MSAVERLNGDTLEFNILAGNFEEDKQAQLIRIDNQISYIFSELTELIDGFELNDAEEVADGVGDVLVTTFGLMQILTAAGFNMDEVLKRIGENNLTKFPTHISDSDRKVYEGRGWTVTAMGNQFVIKDATGKVMKPFDYKPVDLSGTYPEGFFGEKQ